MPFTPFHMGPGLLIKGILQGSFSLMIFGWTQIVMDIQPLIVMITGEGHLHGFTHTYIGATCIAIFAAVTGKHLAEFGLILLRVPNVKPHIRWWVVFFSAAIGSASHVVIDSIMHSDMQPWAPFSGNNPMLAVISIETLHLLCVYSAIVGASVFYAVQYLQSRLALRRKPPLED